MLSAFFTVLIFIQLSSQGLEKIFDDFENGMADEVYDKKIEKL